jgi:hypothetical protein
VYQREALTDEAKPPTPFPMFNQTPATALAFAGLAFAVALIALAYAYANRSK